MVVDCGHGGSDSGTKRQLDELIEEKALTLAIGRLTASELKHTGCDVMLTRDADITVPLDERTTKANSQHADLFVSLHINHSPHANEQGFEIFCLDPDLLCQCSTTVPHEKRAALARYATSRHHACHRLATTMEQTLYTTIRQQYPDLIDRGVTHAVWQVLEGTIMPAILIEIGFLSHDQEGKRLIMHDYQEVVARAIAQGIVTFLK